MLLPHDSEVQKNKNTAIFSLFNNIFSRICRYISRNRDEFRLSKKNKNSHLKEFANIQLNYQ